jgi:hypothetical protein
MNTLSKERSIHTSRTIMFSELSRVMDYAVGNGAYFNALNENLINKSTKSNQERTKKGLISLYGFDNRDVGFMGFANYWEITQESERPILALLFAIGKDYLLSETAESILRTPKGEKVTSDKVEGYLLGLHPNRFSQSSIEAIARRIISSWKQAGYIVGKVKCIRTKTNPTYQVVAFALLMSYLNGERGDLILQSKWAKALDLSEDRLRELTVEAAQRDLLQYQFAGSVTTISFEKFLSKFQA